MLVHCPSQRNWTNIIMLPVVIILLILSRWGLTINPFKLEFIMVIFIYYKPRMAVAILDL